ncbi:MAG: ATP-binding cassette domain-containing protein [Nitrospirae bacterium]|nr:MAG: ATP-binding cassette domain-containing protein [Nitrospirota bacterium]
MMTLRNVSANGFSDISFESGTGRSVKIIVDSDDEKNLLLRLVTGLQKPDAGEVLLFGKEIYSISEDEYIKLFEKAAVVPGNGGLISNLRVWENITLPIEYHQGINPQDLEDRIIRIVRRLLGINTDIERIEKLMQQLPGHLSPHEKRVVGVVKAFIAEPEVIIYDSIFEGLNPEMQDELTTMTTQFHKEKAGRVSLYLTSDEYSLRKAPADIILRQAGTELKEMR